MSNKTDIFAHDFSSKDDLLRRLKKHTKVLNDGRLKEAFKEIDRKDFVRPDYRIEAYEDYPLPIGEGQTISQPTTVAFMLELLDPHEGEEVLDIGSGSGWTAAILGKLVGRGGKVVGVEVINDLVEFARSNLEKYNMDHVEIRHSKGGIPEYEEAPFDRILVSAASDDLPEGILGQLKVDGVLVIPIVDTITKITKKKGGKVEKEEYPGFAFVPFRK